MGALINVNSRGFLRHILLKTQQQKHPSTPFCPLDVNVHQTGSVERGFTLGNRLNSLKIKAGGNFPKRVGGLGIQAHVRGRARVPQQGLEG